MRELHLALNLYRQEEEHLQKQRVDRSSRSSRVEGEPKSARSKRAIDSRKRPKHGVVYMDMDEDTVEFGEIRCREIDI